MRTKKRARTSAKSGGNAAAVPSRRTPPEETTRVSRVETTFICDVEPDAREAYLTGEFNGWNPRSIRMARQGRSFRKKLTLAPGEYQYKFVVDGEWHIDPSASIQRPNEFGGMNSVVQVQDRLDESTRTPR